MKVKKLGFWFYAITIIGVLFLSHLVILGYPLPVYYDIIYFLFESNNPSSYALKGILLSYFMIIVFPVSEDYKAYKISILLTVLSLIISIYLIIIHISLSNDLIKWGLFVFIFLLVMTFILNTKSKTKSGRFCHVIVITDMANKTVYDWIYTGLSLIGIVYLIAIMSYL